MSVEQNSNSDPVLDERQAASFLGIAAATLRNWRYLRKGPSFVKMFGAVRYRQSDLMTFLRLRTVRMVTDGPL